MVFVACGLNHKTAPLALRERVALDVVQQPYLLQELTGLGAAREAAILSTCNRTEIYCDTHDSEAVIDWMARTHAIQRQVLTPHIYQHKAEQAVRHTLRVASGLDSMMLGEPQILGQLKRAYQQACDSGTVNKTLRGVFEYVFATSKRIRNQSGIGVNPVSVAYAAAQMVLQYFTRLDALNVLLIGSGETAHLTAKYLHQEGIKQFFVASRTLENANLLAQAFNGHALTITDISHYLAQADVVISATACPLPFINKNLVEHSLAQRNNAPMFFIDLAIPRDIEANVAELDEVVLYNIDDLQHMITKGKRQREMAAFEAEKLIDCAMEDYLRKHRALKANRVIIDYRSRMQEVAFQELLRARARLASGEQQNEVLEAFCHRLTNKLLHQPSEGLRKAAWDGREDLLSFTHYLFDVSMQESDNEEIT